MKPDAAMSGIRFVWEPGSFVTALQYINIRKVKIR
jgi:hypothetical protein